MKKYIGFDIGGTKIAGAVLNEEGREVASCRLATPSTYADFLNACVAAIKELEEKSGFAGPIGISIPGGVLEDKGTANCSNLPIKGEAVRDDLARLAGREIKIANDANCMALAEYVEGAGKGVKNMFGMIFGTGIGGASVFNGQIMAGLNGMSGEFAQLPLPFREPEDGPVITDCACHQIGCIEKSICASGLERLYTFMTKEEKTTFDIAAAARAGEAEALRVLDRFYEVFAKALIAVMHTFDPERIVVAGGLNDLPGLYEEVPKRLLKYAVFSSRVPEITRAAFGPESGLRGAAWLWR